MSVGLENPTAAGSPSAGGGNGSMPSSSAGQAAGPGAGAPPSPAGIATQVPGGGGTVHPSVGAAAAVAGGQGLQAPPAGAAGTAQPTLRDRLAQMGLRGFAQAPDDSAAAMALAAAHAQAQQQLPQLQQLARLGQEYQRHESAFRDYLRQRQEQERLAAQQQQRKWEAPEFDPGWRNLLRQDEQGNLVALPGADPDLPRKYQAYAQWRAQQEASFWKDPRGFFVEQLGDVLQAIRDEAERKAHDTFVRNYAQLQREHATSQIVEQVKPLLYDQAGQLTPQGQAYQQALQMLLQAQNDPGLQHALVSRLIGLQTAGNRQAASGQHAAGQAVADQAKQNFLAGALAAAGQQGGMVPNRTGTLAAAADPNAPAQNPEQSFRDMAMTLARNQGLIPAASN